MRTELHEFVVWLSLLTHRAARSMCFHAVTAVKRAERLEERSHRLQMRSCQQLSADSESDHVRSQRHVPGRFIRESKALFKVASCGDAAGAQTVQRRDDSGAAFAFHLAWRNINAPTYSHTPRTTLHREHGCSHSMAYGSLKLARRAIARSRPGSLSHRCLILYMFCRRGRRRAHVGPACPGGVFGGADHR